MGSWSVKALVLLSTRRKGTYILYQVKYTQFLTLSNVSYMSAFHQFPEVDTVIKTKSGSAGGRWCEEGLLENQCYAFN